MWTKTTNLDKNKLSMRSNLRPLALFCTLVLAQGQQPAAVAGGPKARTTTALWRVDQGHQGQSPDRSWPSSSRDEEDLDEGLLGDDYPVPDHADDAAGSPRSKREARPSPFFWNLFGFNGFRLRPPAAPLANAFRAPNGLNQIFPGLDYHA